MGGEHLGLPCLIRGQTGRANGPDHNQALQWISGATVRNDSVWPRGTAKQNWLSSMHPWEPKKTQIYPSNRAQCYNFATLACIRLTLLKTRRPKILPSWEICRGRVSRIENPAKERPKASDLIWSLHKKIHSKNSRWKLRKFNRSVCWYRGCWIWVPQKWFNRKSELKACPIHNGQVLLVQSRYSYYLTNITHR